MDEMKIPVMLTLREASKRTGLSYDFIRKICLQKRIVSVRCGAKFLVNLDSLVRFLNGQEADDEKRL